MDDALGGPTTTVESWLTVHVSEPASIALQLAVTLGPDVAVDDVLTITLDGRPVPAKVIADQHHGRQHLVHAEPGTLAITYRGLVTHVGPPVPEAVSDDQRLSATRPSRYCPSDRMAGFARAHFGHLHAGTERVRSICDYVWQRISYQAGVTAATSDAVDTLL